MSQSGYLKRRRIKLWNESPACRWCGVETILPEELARRYGDANKAPYEVAQRMATIEHVHSRLSGRYQTHGREETLTLFCRKCNNERGAQEMRSLPIEEVRARCGQYPLAFWFSFIGLLNAAATEASS